jgi:2,5-dichloro-2,5-cyclohexadiene-1,4-diol dehydrogenase 1
MSSVAFKSLDLAERVIIVTGAASGIGRAATMLFCQRGATVVAADVNDAQGDTLMSEVRTSGGRAAYIHTDVSSEADVEAMVHFAVSEFGALHGAFNNAGIISRGSPLEAMPLAEWQRVIDVNLTGMFLCLKHEIAHMVKNGGGSIVNTSSGSGVVGSPNMADYVASKHGVIGLTRAAAIDYSARGIRTNAVVPGATETPMLAGTMASDPLIRRMLEQGHPIGHLGKPIEIAEAAAWLLSDASSFVTGLCLCIDGGYTAA